MKLFATVGVAAVTMLAIYQSVDAWSISASDAIKSEDILGPHQEFTKTWTVSGAETLTSIRLAAAGPVFVDYDSTLNPVGTVAPSPTASLTTGSGSGSGGFRGLPTIAADATDNVVAKVVLSGNCTALLDVFEVIEHDGDLKVHFKNEDFKGYGYVLAQVYLGEKDTVAKVVTSGSSNVYVSENVVVASNASAEVELIVSGDGELFVTAPSTGFVLKSLDLKISGSGNVQFNVDSLTASDSLSAKISGEGDIAVVAAGAVAVNNTLANKISGSGNLFIQAESVTAFTLDSKISGDGYIALSRNGSCVSQDISISGEGTIASGSIACVDTKIRLSGDGSVLVQTSQTLRVPHTVEGTIQYVGAAPQLITDGRKPKQPKKRKHHFHFWWSDDDDSDDSEDDDDTHLPKSVTQAPTNEFQTYEVRAVPAREPEFLVLSIHSNFWSEDPNLSFIIGIFGEDIGNSIMLSTQNMAAHVKKHGTFSITTVAVIAGIALVAAGVALRKFKTQARRHEYQPLLQVVTNNNSGARN